MRFYKLSLRDQFRHAALWVLLCAFVLRALIPVGYMPDFGSLNRGALKVVICTGAGSKTLVLDATGDPVPSRQTRKVDHPCAFTGIAAAVASFANLEFIAQRYSSHRFLFLTASQSFLRNPGFVLGPRGPPRLA